MAKGGKRFGSGRKRVPTERKVLEGRFRRDRDGNPPRVAPGFPDAPEHLTEAERALWAVFPRPIWITESDRIALEGAVALYARILTNRQQQVLESTPTLVTQEAQLWGRLMTYLASLGLTPSDRGKMATPEADDDAKSGWAGILS